MDAEKIIDIVCSELGVNVSDLNLHRNTRHQIEARHISTYFIREYTPNITLAKIALLFNRKLKTGVGDHAAAIYSINLTEDLLKIKDKGYSIKFNKCKEAIERNRPIR